MLLRTQLTGYQQKIEVMAGRIHFLLPNFSNCLQHKGTNLISSHTVVRLDYFRYDAQEPFTQASLWLIFMLSQKSVILKKDSFTTYLLLLVLLLQ